MCPFPPPHSDYTELLSKVVAPGADAAAATAFRQRMAWKAFQHCSTYDIQVSEWLWGQVGGGGPAPLMTVPLALDQTLRWGVRRWGEGVEKKA